MQQKQTKNLLDNGNNNLLGKIGCRLPNNQRLDFLKQYSNRLDDNIIYDIATKIPPDNLLEFFKLKLLKRENDIASLATRLPKENILEFFKLEQLNGYYDDNKMKVARRLPPQELIRFFQMKFLCEEKNIAELATKLSETDILKFFKMKLLSDENDIAKIAKNLPAKEFIQFWNLGLIHDLILVKPIIKKIPDELLNSFIDETDDYNLKSMFVDAIRDPNLHSGRQNQLRIFAENEVSIASLEQICEQGTPKQKKRICSIIKALSQSSDLRIEIIDKTPFDD